MRLINTYYCQTALLLLCLVGSFLAKGAEVTVGTVAELTVAINQGAAGDTVHLAAGTYVLTASQQLRPKARMVIRGAGIDRTIIRAAASWNPDTTQETTDEDGTDRGKVDRRSYFIDIRDASEVHISNMTIRGGDKIHGVIIAMGADQGDFHHLRLERFHWSAIRTFKGGHNIHDNILVNAAGRPGQVSAGGIYMTWTDGTEIWNNHITMTDDHPTQCMGIKFRQIRNTRIHHNTIDIPRRGIGFVMEAAHKTDYNVEIDHNRFMGTISVPKNGGGGAFPEGSYTFWIHHNWLSRSYTFEGPRRGLEIDHNFIEPDGEKDYKARTWTDHSRRNAMMTPSVNMHDNLIRDPGRAIFWSIGSTYAGFIFNNNEVRSTQDTLPHTLFQFPKDHGFENTQIKNNIFDCKGGPARKLLSRTTVDAIQIENNALINIADAGNYDNPTTGAPRGADDLYFTCGYHEDFLVDNWEAYPTASRSKVILPANPVVIQARHSGKVLEIAAASTIKGGNAQQNTYTGDRHQQWNLIEDSTGYYTLQNVNSSLVLDVYGQSVDNRANVVQWTSYPQDNQRFSIRSAGEGYVKIVPVHSGKCLDVYGGVSATEDGVNVFQWTYHGNANQQWLIQSAATLTVNDSIDASPAGLPSDAFEGRASPGAFRAYPNPNDGLLHVSAPEPGTLLINNSLGQLVHQQAVVGDTEISLATYPPGIYTVRMKTSHKTYSEKIIKR